MLKIQITKSEMDQIEKFSPDLKILVEMVQEKKIEIRLKGGTAKFILAYLWQVRPQLQAKWAKIATIPNLTDLDGWVKINSIELYHSFPEHLVQDFRFDDTGWYTCPSIKTLRAQLNGQFATMMGVDSPIGEIALFGREGNWWFTLGDGFAWDINPYQSKLPPFKEWKDVEFQRGIKRIRRRWFQLYWEAPIQNRKLWLQLDRLMGEIKHPTDLYYIYRDVFHGRDEEWYDLMGYHLKKEIEVEYEKSFRKEMPSDLYFDMCREKFKSIVYYGWFGKLDDEAPDQKDLWHFPRYGWRIGDEVNQSQWAARSLVFQERYKLQSNVCSLNNDALAYALHKKLKLKDLLKKGIITLELYLKFKGYQEEEKEEKNEEDKYWDEARRWFPGEGY